MTSFSSVRTRLDWLRLSFRLTCMMGVVLGTVVAILAWHAHGNPDATLSGHERMGQAAHATVIFIAGAVLVSVCLLALVIGTRTRRQTWRLSWMTSVILSAAVVVVWNLILAHSPYSRSLQEGSGEPLLNHQATASLQPQQLVPTGIYIQSIEFTDADNVRISGYVWQRFSPEQSALKVARGVTFPEATEMTSEPSHDYTFTAKDGQTTFGWGFTATLHQRFDYRAYPFDSQAVWLRIWTTDVDHNIVLVPDLKGYDHLLPADRPGLNTNLFLPSWTVTSTFFSYLRQSYNTNWGIDDEVDPATAQTALAASNLELQYNIIMSRRLLNPMVASGLPIVVILFITFILMLMITRGSQQAAIYGFNTTTLIGTIAALFLVMIFEQVNLRRALGQDGICHLEVIYFLIYLAFTGLAMNSFIISRSRRTPLFFARDSLLPKALFWPLICTGVLVIGMVEAW